MKLKYLLFKTAILSALLTGAFSVNSAAQTSGARASEKNSVSNSPKIVKTNEIKPASNGKYSSEQLFDLERQAFSLINQKRAETGLTPLAWSDEVARVARLHSENMVKYNFFGHAGQDGSMVDDRADSLGLGKWRLIGENIAYNRGYARPVEIAVENWMQSEGHRQNILNRGWRESGIGIAVKADGAFYFTQVFLLRK